MLAHKLANEFTKQFSGPCLRIMPGSTNLFQLLLEFLRKRNLQRLYGFHHRLNLSSRTLWNCGFALLPRFNRAGRYVQHKGYGCTTEVVFLAPLAQLVSD